MLEIGPFFGYMALSNWLVVLLWGAFQGQRDRANTKEPHWVGGMIVLAGLVALSLAVFGFNMLGDALRDLLDPRLKGG